MDYNIVDYGAIADGVTNNRQAIQAAIDACIQAGGGRVIIPAGRFLSGTIILGSNVELHLASGAVLISSLNPDDLVDISTDTDDPNEDIGWEGGCFLYAAHAENISITGQGTIYGQGDKIFYDDYADGGYHECPKNVHQQDRPRTTYLEDIENLTVRDITFRDAAFWTLHMAGCRHVLVNNVRIYNDVRGANNDGIDPDTCQDVVISNCIVESGDDCIVVKNSAPMARRYGACENIVITGCILSSHDSALKIGTETCEAIRHVILSDCIMRACSRGVGIWVRDGAVIEDIHIHDISGDTRQYADCPQRAFAPRWWGKGEPLYLSATPRHSGEHPGIIRGVTFHNIHMTSESCVFIAGEEDSRIENIEIRNLDLTMRCQGTQTGGLFDEQPSVRGVYEHTIPGIYARCVDHLLIDGTIIREAPYQDTELYQLESCTDALITVDAY